MLLSICRRPANQQRISAHRIDANAFTIYFPPFASLFPIGTYIYLIFHHFSNIACTWLNLSFNAYRCLPMLMLLSLLLLLFVPFLSHSPFAYPSIANDSIVNDDNSVCEEGLFLLLLLLYPSIYWMFIDASIGIYTEQKIFILNVTWMCCCSVVRELLPTIKCKHANWIPLSLSYSHAYSVYFVFYFILFKLQFNHSFIFYSFKVEFYFSVQYNFEHTKMEESKNRNETTETGNRPLSTWAFNALKFIPGSFVFTCTLTAIPIELCIFRRFCLGTMFSLSFSFRFDTICVFFVFLLLLFVHLVLFCEFSFFLLWSLFGRLLYIRRRNIYNELNRNFVFTFCALCSEMVLCTLKILQRAQNA